MRPRYKTSCSVNCDISFFFERNNIKNDHGVHSVRKCQEIQKIEENARKLSGKRDFPGIKIMKVKNLDPKTLGKRPQMVVTSSKNR